MADASAFLEKVHIRNYLSLQDVELPLKPLTVLVGPNASGKSNVLKALRLLKTMMTREELPSDEFVRDSLWAGEASQITFQLRAEVKEIQAVYGLDLKAETDNLNVTEGLSVDGVEVISIQSGEGVVTDEDGKNGTNYKSKKLALKSAGDYGN
ncbi:MAG: AAA family ATPase [Candidatus Poribacteria bacterium]|nr:AAA family ATPase [Candidatus Poribacteria bacterium]MDE0505569.1 AAA family ATPase [Candidatus Poribacteria bacterium]